MAKTSYGIVTFIILYISQDVVAEWDESNYSPELLQGMPGYGDSWMYMPNGDGNPIVALLKDSGYGTEARQVRNVHRDVTFDLYTRKTNKNYELKVGDRQRLQASTIDFSKNTKIITHGWMSSNKSNTCQRIKEKYLLMKDYNVIIVDWAPIAKNVFYFIPMMDTAKVGEMIAKMIDFLVENGAKLDRIHLIGHSLGAHVCGYAGAGSKYGKVGRITGLDPALPGYELIAGRNGKLDANDAQFVDIIHTCAGVLGYYSDIGDVDFYPNGGTPSQPGCFGFTQAIESCSHGRAWEFFIESVGNPDAFPATRCDSWKQFIAGDCRGAPRVPMGEELKPGTKGKYYLRTTHVSPFRAL